MSKIPAYRKVYTMLKQNIRDQVYPVGSLLPTEAELEKKFGVSRTTVRKAVSMLVADGYLQAKQGKGTEVLDVSTTQRLNGISSVTETLKEKGYKVTTQGMWIQKVPAPEPVAAALNIPVGEVVYQLQRVQCADGTPIALMTNYLRVNLIPGFEQHLNAFVGLYSFLEKQYKIVFRDAVETLTAVAADFTESQILHVEVGFPLLCSKRVTRNESGPVEYSIIKLVADKYEYSVYLQGRH